MKIMINRLILISMAIIVILFVGCKKVEDEIGVNNDPDPTIEIEIPKEPDEIMKEFYQMINGNETTKNILMFVGNGIGKLDINNADTMILDYEGYLIKDINILLKQYESANSNPELTKIFDAGIKENISTLKDEDLKNLLNRTLDSGYLLLKSGGYIYPEINYKEMLEYRDFISEGVLNYIEIMDTETSNRFTYGEKIEISLKELLNRALRAENYLIDNKGASTSNKVYELYIQYIDASILGNGNPYTLALDGSGIIKDEIFDEYKDFVSNNKESKTAQILQEYLNVLESNNKDLNSPQVIEFYDNRYSDIKELFRDLDL